MLALGFGLEKGFGCSDYFMTVESDQYNLKKSRTEDKENAHLRTIFVHN